MSGNLYQTIWKAPTASKKGTSKFTWEAGVKKELLYQGLTAANKSVGRSTQEGSKAALCEQKRKQRKSRLDT